MLINTYRPSFPFTVRALLLKPIYTQSHGVVKKTYNENQGEEINISFKTYGGTESTNNNIYTIIDTAIIETWYRQDIVSDCRLKILSTNVVYEILGNVENIDMRNQFLKFKVRAIIGGA